MQYGLSVDETSLICGWHLPEAHYLETWSDARATDGTASIVQPLIEPLYDSRSPHELVAMLTDFQETPGRQIVRGYWQEQREVGGKEGGFEPFWQKCLHDGVVPSTVPAPKDVAIQDGWQQRLQESMQTVPSRTDALDLVIQPDPTLHDGAWANNGWLQELSKPLTKLAWGNAAIMSPATARRLGVKQGSYAHGGEHGGYYMPVVTLELDGRKVDAPAWIMPGHADGTITVWLGHGRRHAGHIGGSESETIGFDAYALRTSAKPWFATGLKVAPTGRTELVACTQAHQSMEGREPVHAATLARYRKHPESVAESELEKEHAVVRIPREKLTLYDSVDYGPPKHKWAMAIDLTVCTGCMACVVACQAENNIAVVGKDEVLNGREMHWLRVDRYVAGEPEHPEAFHFQPVPCMHCENAPCEYVCPVEATVHSAEGLNDMVYNRCVGTRFCSNNCPYKVRRFNFKFYSDYETKSRRLQYNPDVTVRSRGVMEKCSYCVQRLRRAEVDSQAEDRPLRDGEVLTACQAACPVKAIQFGDLNDPNSAVGQWRGSPLNYNLLDETNTHPRTTYLAELKNPNPELDEA